MSPFSRYLLLLLALTGAQSAVAQVVLGQVDDFQNGTVQNWSGFEFFNIPDGGPGGAGDRFLQVTSHGGFGQGSHLATFNQSQWSGNYQAAGVTGISLNIRNQGSTALNMRLCLVGVNGDRWTNTVGVALAPGSGWQRVVFSLDPVGMTRVLGNGTYEQTFSNVGRLLIRHDANAPSSGGTSIAGQMGLDNIRAVPEPATVIAVATGLLALASRRRK